ncbi:DUF3298 and DUF4163 domain-containing protein [Dyadobacter flavalbus]|uniref:DUF3298 and DUF4163 domain-containing protein n=1 Tax=Dyadobacter flavalbus TaxID=2579942 RepID=A0A5M8QRB6_9BACT|nr:DUF3298 and DUF4163 domain-containing protein [Dyadobacter flavalbus]KAA6438619.1 DUF3298 and DUF4163 domain-containing protein [Dyadobacter flavalbus]
MMRIAAGCILLLLAVWFTGCGTPGNSGEKVKPEPVHGKMIRSSYGKCDTVSNSGVSLKINLWTPSDSNSATGAISNILTAKSLQRINSYLDSATLASMPSASGSVDDAFKLFQKNYNDFKKDFPDAPGCWEVELKGDTVMTTPKVLQYRLDHYAFTGGAHPNSFRSFHIFDRTTGEETDIKKCITDSVSFLKLVEKHFRKTENLAPDMDLEKAGYFLSDHKFFIPASYALTREGILFYYNPYEIAPYARGAIQFVIPYSELENVMDKAIFF